MTYSSGYCGHSGFSLLTCNNILFKDNLRWTETLLQVNRICSYRELKRLIASSSVSPYNWCILPDASDGSIRKKCFTNFLSIVYEGKSKGTVLDFFVVALFFSVLTRLFVCRKFWTLMRVVYCAGHAKHKLILQFGGEWGWRISTETIGSIEHTESIDHSIRAEFGYLWVTRSIESLVNLNFTSSKTCGVLNIFATLTGATNRNGMLCFMWKLLVWFDISCRP